MKVIIKAVIKATINPPAVNIIAKSVYPAVILVQVNAALATTNKPKNAVICIVPLTVIGAPSSTLSCSVNFSFKIGLAIKPPSPIFLIYP